MGRKIHEELTIMMLKFYRDNFKKIAFAMAIFLIIYLLLGQKFKALAIIVLLMIIATFSTFYYNYFHSPFNMELVKFTTILVSAAYGSLTGLVFGIATSIFSRIWGSRLDHRVFISLLGIVVVAAAAPMISLDIRIAGMILIIIYHSITIPISISLGDNPGFVIMHGVTNIFFNAIIFYFAGPFIFSIITS